MNFEHKLIFANKANLKKSIFWGKGHNCFVKYYLAKKLQYIKSVIFVMSVDTFPGK